MIYRALNSVLKGLCRWGMRLTLAWADVRPFWTSCKKMRDLLESAFIVRIFLPVSYMKVSPFMVFTRRFSSLICCGLSTATVLCGAGAALGLSQVKATVVIARRPKDNTVISDNVFIGIILT